MMLTFVVIVIVPGVLAWQYLDTRAADQYHSRAAFSIRYEEPSSQVEALAGFGATASAGTQDAEILRAYIQSQPLLEEIDAAFGMDAVFGADPRDWVFALEPGQSVEGQLRYWQRMVQVTTDASTGVVELEVRAFDPGVAQAVARAIVAQCEALLNSLNQAINEDAILFAQSDLARAENRLADTRLAVQQFRAANQIVDPEAQSAILGVLQTRLANSLVRRNTLLQNTNEDDPRVVSVEQEIRSIEALIESERVANSDVDLSEDPVDIAGDYERLVIELEFAEATYTAALAGLDTARAQGRRTSRYLAVHIPPTRAQDSLYPREGLLLALTLVAGFALWVLLVLISYNARDRT